MARGIDLDVGAALLRALDETPVGVSVGAIIDGAPHRLYANRALAEMVGASSLEDLAAAPPLQTVAPEDRERMASIAREWGDNRSRVVETTILRRDGERVPVEVRVGGTQVDGIPVTVALLLDTRARRDMEAALRASEARFRKLAEAAPDTITLIAGGRFVYVNPAAVAALGFDDAEELMARPLDQLLFPEEMHVMMTRIRELSRGATLAPREYHGRRKDGTIATLEISAITIEHEGQPAVLAIGRDISARKRSQAELMRADRMATVGALAAGVAHEVNNPLTYVLAHLRRLRALVPGLISAPEERRKIEQLFAEAEDGGERVARIVRELLTFASPGSDEPQAVNVAEVLDSVLSLAGTTLDARAELERRYAEVPAARADAPRLAQVFLNLVKNAVQAFDSDDRARNRITVELGTDRGWIVIEVADNGPGIPPQVLERIFEPFFTTKPPGTGTGLGLSISRTIVESYGGEITATSSPGEGTRMRVRLRPWLQRG